MMAKRILLSRGYVALVDDQDADLMYYRWYALHDGCNVYGVRYERGVNGGWNAVYLHRVILARKLLRPLLPYPDELTDHRSGNTLDCRRENIRLATYAQNNRNARKRKDNTSGYQGIDFHKHTGMWRARITVDKRQHHLGLFRSPVHAAIAYDLAAIELHGAFASLNFQEMT